MYKNGFGIKLVDMPKNQTKLEILTQFFYQRFNYVSIPHTKVYTKTAVNLISIRNLTCLYCQLK